MKFWMIECMKQTVISYSHAHVIMLSDQDLHVYTVNTNSGRKPQFCFKHVIPLWFSTSPQSACITADKLTDNTAYFTKPASPQPLPLRNVTTEVYFIWSEPMLTLLLLAFLICLGSGCPSIIKPELVNRGHMMPKHYTCHLVLFLILSIGDKKKSNFL